MTKACKRTTLFGAAILFAAGLESPAWAQATRTWVSGVGDDANPCSRTAPCKTFAGAISKTAAAGEINCLDPGGFGGVTITKSISIICDFTEGGVLSAGAGVNGIVINMQATDSVFLSGLDFNGAGSAQNGIRIVSGGTVHVQNSIIRNYRASNGLGMSVQPAGALRLTVYDTTVADNGTGATGGGILIQATGSGSANIVLRNIRLQNNSNNALALNTTGNPGAGIIVQVENSEISGSTDGIDALTPPATTGIIMTLENVSLLNNSGSAILGNGATVLMRVSNSTITNNGTGINASGSAQILTYGNNRLVGNASPGAFTGSATPL
jgi:hypothetical protein